MASSRGVMLTCKELTEVITDYLEGHLSFLQRLRFQFHLGMCGKCRTYLHQMRTMVHALGQFPEEAVPPAIREELLRRFLDWKVESKLAQERGGES